MSKYLKFIFNHPFKFAFIFIIILFLTCVIFSHLAISPAWIKSFSLQNQDKLGAAIGGLTAPVVGIGTATLLFLALSYQIRSNDEQHAFNQIQVNLNVSQKQKSEADFILLLFNQFGNELNAFYHNTVVEIGNKSENVNLKGLAAINRFVSDYVEIFVPALIKNRSSAVAGPQVFEDFFESGQLSVLIDSLNLLANRIEESNITEENKIIFRKKFRSYYENYFHRQLVKIADSFKAFRIFRYI